MKLLTSDKSLHFLYSFFLASIWWPLGIGFAIGKEAWDWFKYGKKLGLRKFLSMSAGDLLADALGVLLAFFIGGV